jgi:branched-chain amino acid transport system permease protein
MELLNILFVAPFLDMADSPVFFAEVVITGLLTGIMYSLVALGFVLIFKASGVFNFAQGAMVLFAALTLVGLMERGVPIPLALVGTILVMIALAMLIERMMLRHLVNQEGIILFMATIGGLIIGVGEKIAEIYWGPAFGGAIEGWFAYMLALAFLMFRPQGLFGEKIIERV